jgi:thiopurine S-methyltransferase
MLATMDDDFWRSRWEKGLTGFHEGAPNAFLRTHHVRLVGPAGPGRVLVPLSGKSVDLAFLAAQGFDVTGIELVRQAAEAFFLENGLEPTAAPWHGFEALSAGGVRIAVGNFFGLGLPGPERFDAAYDRAALVALRPEDRERYVATLVAALRPGAHLLLVTFAHDGAMAGPPFSVSDAEVRRLYAAHQLELLDEKDITETEPRFKERGVTRIVEQAWLVVIS